MISRQEILQKTIDIIYESAPELEGKELTEETVINTDTGIDSMGFTLIICRLEARLNVKIPQRQWARMSTFGDVVTAFDRKINKKFIL